jgi:hypothetical protein
VPVTPGAFDTQLTGGHDVFLAKLDAAGATLLYGTYLGGVGDQFATALTLDAAGRAAVTGWVLSYDFPVTPDAFDPTTDGHDAFLTQFNADGSGLEYSTYLGGSDFDAGYGVAISPGGSFYVQGFTRSADFPVTPGALDPTLNANDTFLLKLVPHMQVGSLLPVLMRNP